MYFQNTIRFSLSFQSVMASLGNLELIGEGDAVSKFHEHHYHIDYFAFFPL